MIIILTSNHKFDYSILVILIIWQFIIGIRSIMFHQIEDYNNDLMGNNTTWIVNIGLDKAHRILKTLIIPFEIILLVSSLVMMTKYFTFIIPLTILFWIFTIYRWHFKSNQSLKVNYRKFSYIYFGIYF